MDTYRAQDGGSRTQLNLICRKPVIANRIRYNMLTIRSDKFEALSRPNRDQSTSGAESDADAAEEPLSGVGQS